MRQMRRKVKALRCKRPPRYKCEENKHITLHKYVCIFWLCTVYALNGRKIDCQDNTIKKRSL